MDNNQIWQAVLGEIELNLSKANFTTWFKNSFILSLENNEVILCVPNTFTKTWLEKKYHHEIKKALSNIINQEIKNILYKVQIKKSESDNRIEKINVNAVETIPRNIKKNINLKSSYNNYGLNPKYIFESFIVGKGNELAHAAAQAVTANPGKTYNPLFIYGGVGLGKTHLLQAIGNEVAKKHKVLYITSEKFTNDYVQAVHGGKAKDFKDHYRNVDMLLIDDVQFMAGKDGTQEEFFHTFNDLQQNDRQIIITSDKPPKSIPALEKRLLSRFESGMVADVSKPDIETKIAILQEKAKEKNYSLNKEILEYISNNINNNIRELEGALNKIIAFHEFNNSIPTLKTTKNILNDLLINIQAKNTTLKDVICAVCDFYNIKDKDLLGKGRKKEIVWPRQIAIFLMREELNASYPTIGQELGGRDHTTAMHAYNKILEEIGEKENEKIKQEIESIKQILNS
jgi:chromosomal replication initiator protein